MPWSILYEGTCLLNLKPASKKEAMAILDLISFFGFTRQFIYQRYLLVADYLRKFNGNTWIWDDGRSSLFAPAVESDKQGCWYYDALANRLIFLASETHSGVKRMPWITVTLEQGDSSMDVTDHFTGLTYEAPAGTIPSILVIRTLLTQKLGIYVGGSAVFRVYCRSDLLDEKIFGADLEEENDIENWNSSWN